MLFRGLAVSCCSSNSTINILRVIVLKYLTSILLAVHSVEPRTVFLHFGFGCMYVYRFEGYFVTFDGGLLFELRTLIFKTWVGKVIISLERSVVGKAGTARRTLPLFQQ